MHRRLLAVLSVFLAVALLTACAPIVRVSTGTGPTIYGSRNFVEKSFDLTGFTAVDVSAGATARVTKADATSVKITVDDNAVDYLRVEKRGDTLVVGLKDGSFNNVTIKAAITMPELTGLTASGGSRVSFDGFVTTKPVAFNVSGGADITGTMDAGLVTVKASGGATMTVSGKGQGLTLNHSGGGTVKLGNFQVSDANVNVSGGSRSEINATGKVTGSVSGGGQVKLVGQPASVQVGESGGGKVVR